MTLIKNIFSVDLEDHYIRTPFEGWDEHKSRVIEPTQILLDLFEKYKVEATFFTLGYLAKRHPELIEQIVSKGHEISSHSFAHRDVMTMTKQEFEDDLVKSLDILRKISGEQPLGFRAPRFSINKNSFWAFSILQKHLKYDSSIFPVSHIHYGIPDAPRGIYKMSHEDPLLENEDSNFTELPLATLPILGYGNFLITRGF